MTDSTSPTTPAPTTAHTPPPSAPPGSALEIATMLADGRIDTTQARKLARAGNITMLAVAQARHAAPAAPPVTPTGPQAELSTREAATMADWTRKDVASGTLSPEAAAKIFDDLGTPADQRGPDVRSDEQKMIDKHFPAAKPEEFTIRYNAIGDDAPISAETKQFDTSARTWLSSAGFPRDVGNSLVNIIAKVAQSTKDMTPDQLETYRQTELLKLQRAHGEKLEERLQAADDMIDQLEHQRPGLKHVLGSNGIGKNAMVWNMLIQHAPIFHARKGR